MARTGDATPGTSNATSPLHYFASIRYSEDIALDVTVISKGTLKNNVDRLLVSPLIVAPLAAKGVHVIEISTPKQTETIQRWKAGLRVDGLDIPIRTKIEFSRRGEIVGAPFEAVNRTALQPYGLTPFLATHYTTQAAIAQKVHALAGRTEPQARDVFDLNLLLARTDADAVPLTDAQRAWVPTAVERAMSISFDDYASKVVSYLDPTQAELFEDRSAWNAMQDAVVSRLEALR